MKVADDEFESYGIYTVKRDIQLCIPSMSYYDDLSNFLPVLRKRGSKSYRIKLRKMLQNRILNTQS